MLWSGALSKPKCKIKINYTRKKLFKQLYFKKFLIICNRTSFNLLPNLASKLMHFVIHLILRDD